MHSLKLLAALALLATCLCVGCGRGSVMRESEENKQLIMAVGRALAELDRIAISGESDDLFDMGHRISASADDARAELDPWRNDENTERRRIIRELDRALDTLRESGEALVDVRRQVTRTAAEDRMSSFSVKLSQGRRQLSGAVLGMGPYDARGDPVLVTGGGLPLTAKDRESARAYIEMLSLRVVARYQGKLGLDFSAEQMPMEALILIGLQVTLSDEFGRAP